MNLPPRIKLGAAGLGVVALLSGVWWWYAGFNAQRDAMDGDIARIKDELLRMDTDLGQESKLKKRLAELASGSLGTTEEVVSASLRTALNEIAEDCGLSGPSVTTREPEVMRNPSTQGNSTVVDFSKEMRSRIDFLAMGATLQGTGTLEQVLRALVTVQSQAWASRVDSVSLAPAGSGKERGSRVVLNLRLTTVFVPDIQGKAGEALWKKPDAAALGRVQYLVAKNVFKEPVAVAVAPAPPKADPTPPAPPAGQPYGEWRVTGLVKGVAGPELWLVNDRTRQAVMLGVGQTVMDAVFVGAKGELARIKIGEQEYEVALSQTLQDRKVVSR